MPSSTIASFLTSFGLFASFAATPALGNTYSFRLIAQSGDPAPSSLGGAFVSFGHPRINASGQVSFQATTTGAIADSGLWRTLFDDPQTLALIIGEDFPVPGAPAGTKFGAFQSPFHHPLLNDDSNIGFAAPVTLGDGTVGVFRMIDGVITKVALPNDSMPGLPAGTQFKTVGNLISFNANNLVALNVTLKGPGITALNDEGFVLTWFGGLNMLAREGNGAPGIPATTFGTMLLTYPLLTDNGQVAFDIPLNGASNAKWSRWRGWPGGLSLLAKEGDPTPLGGTFAGEHEGFWTMGTTADGASFVERFENDAGLQRAVWRVEDTIESALVEGGVGPLGTYEEISGDVPATAVDSTLATFARFAIANAVDTALVLSPPQGAAEVALREGDPAPGYVAGVQFDDLVDFDSFTDVSSANSHRVLVSAATRGPGITDANDRGVWVVDTDGTVRVAAREGSWISLEGGPLGQIALIRVSHSGSTNSGRRSSMNERGDVAMTLLFTNGDEAVVVAQPPLACAADVTGDGVVDAADLAIVLGAWGETGPVGTGGDVDRDGDTDAADLAAVLGAWGACAD